MSFNGRVTQHRPQKESLNRELAELKRENQQLRREVARLTKQLTKELDRTPPAAPEEPAVPVVALTPAADSTLCPDCERPVRVISLGPKTLRACTCGWRKMA